MSIRLMHNVAADIHATGSTSAEVPTRLSNQCTRKRGGLEGASRKATFANEIAGSRSHLRARYEFWTESPAQVARVKGDNYGMGEDTQQSLMHALTVRCKPARPAGVLRGCFSSKKCQRWSVRPETPALPDGAPPSGTETAASGCPPALQRGYVGTFATEIRSRSSATGEASRAHRRPWAPARHSGSGLGRACRARLPVAQQKKKAFPFASLQPMEDRVGRLLITAFETGGG